MFITEEGGKLCWPKMSSTRLYAAAEIMFLLFSSPIFAHKTFDQPSFLYSCFFAMLEICENISDVGLVPSLLFLPPSMYGPAHSTKKVAAYGKNHPIFITFRGPIARWLHRSLGKTVRQHNSWVLIRARRGFGTCSHLTINKLFPLSSRVANVSEIQL